MILSAIKKYGIDKEKSIMVGDQETDVVAGFEAGLKHCYKVDICNRKNDDEFNLSKYKSLYSVVCEIAENTLKNKQLP